MIFLSIFPFSVTLLVHSEARVLLSSRSHHSPRDDQINYSLWRRLSHFACLPLVSCVRVGLLLFQFIYLISKFMKEKKWNENQFSLPVCRYWNSNFIASNVTIVSRALIHSPITANLIEIVTFNWIAFNYSEGKRLRIRFNSLKLNEKSCFNGEWRWITKKIKIRAMGK